MTKAEIHKILKKHIRWVDTAGEYSNHTCVRIMGLTKAAEVIAKKLKESK